ncbi:hypothetical protein, partial [Streptomyces sp. NPDC095602]|uniref:hypothetical protein n=1 Tax=Streptomyces sp. NPDC095602 TaxID=3155819 RepID=UPI003328327E
MPRPAISQGALASVVICVFLLEAPEKGCGGWAASDASTRAEEQKSDARKRIKKAAKALIEIAKD